MLSSLRSTYGSHRLQRQSPRSVQEHQAETHRVGGDPATALDNGRTKELAIVRVAHGAENDKSPAQGCRARFLGQ